MSVKSNLWSWNFVFLATANLLMAVAFYFMLPILPVYLVDKLGASKSEIGFVLAFYTVAALIIRLFAGKAIDTYGRKLIYLLAYLLFSIAFMGYPLASTLLFFIVVRFMHGLTWGVLTTSSSTIAVDIIPVERRGEGIGIFGLSMTIGMAIGPFIAILITGEHRYTLIFTSALAITATGFLLALLVRYPLFQNHSSAHFFKLTSLIEKSAISISLNMLLVMFSYGGVLSFIALYGKEIGVESSGLFFLILSIGIGLSRVLSGKIFDKKGPKEITVMGLLLLIIGFPILGLFSNWLGYHISAFFLGLGFGVIMPTFQAMINNLVPPTRRGAANSTFFTCFDLGIGFGMVGIGILSEFLGFSRTFLVCAVTNFIALCFFLWISLKKYHSYLLKNERLRASKT